MLCLGEYLLIYIAMFQKNNAAEKSATFHICNEAWQNLTLPKIEIPLPHIFTWLNLAQHGSTRLNILSFLASHDLWKFWVNSLVCGLGQWDDQKLWYFVHAWQFEGFSQICFQVPGNETRVLEEVFLRMIWNENGGIALLSPWSSQETLVLLSLV